VNKLKEGYLCGSETYSHHMTCTSKPALGGKPQVLVASDISVEYLKWQVLVKGCFLGEKLLLGTFPTACPLVS